MELVFENKTAAFLRHGIHEVRDQEETSEIIVPDSYPDVERIVSSHAAVILRSKECRSGSIVVSGGIRAGALYVPEDHSQPRCLDAYIPFSIRFEHPAATEHTQPIATCLVRGADARILNSRKVMLRINLACQLDGYEQTSETFYTVKDAPAALQMKTQSYRLQLPVETAEKSFQISEDLELPSGKPAIGTICRYETALYPGEMKLVGARAVFKGSLECRILYLTPDGVLETYSQQIPFSQYCELDQDYGEEDLQLFLAVTGAELERDEPEEGRRLLLSVNVLAQCVVTAARQTELLEDAYTVRGSFQPEWKQYQMDCRLDRQTLHQPMRATVQGPVHALVDSTVYLDYPNQERTGPNVRLTAPAAVNLLYFDEAGELQGMSAKAEAVCDTALSDGCLCMARVQLDNGGFAALAGGGAELRYDVSFDVESSAAEHLKTLCGGTLDPDTVRPADRPSVIICASQTRKPLWNVAKQYGTTVNAIVSANHLEGTEVESGQMLLIPL